MLFNKLAIRESLPAKYIPDLWCVRAAVLQRTGRDEWIEQIGLFQEVDEKRQLTKRSDGFVRRPANMIRPPKLSSAFDSFDAPRSTVKCDTCKSWE